MFSTVSMTGVGIIIQFLTILFAHFEVDVDAGKITEAANAIAYLIGFGFTIFGTWRRWDLKYGILRVIKR